MIKTILNNFDDGIYFVRLARNVLGPDIKGLIWEDVTDRGKKDLSDRIYLSIYKDGLEQCSAQCLHWNKKTIVKLLKKEKINTLR